MHRYQVLYKHIEPTAFDQLLKPHKLVTCTIVYEVFNRKIILNMGRLVSRWVLSAFFELFVLTKKKQAGVIVLTEKWQLTTTICACYWNNYLAKFHILSKSENDKTCFLPRIHNFSKYLENYSFERLIFQSKTEDHR